MYDTGRFFAMTGRALGAHDGIADCTEAIKPLHERYIGGGGMERAAPAAGTTLTDGEVLERARASRAGEAFTRLYDGDWSGLYASRSEADLALCGKLAFWCGRDMAQMDRLFRASGLMREKWDRRQAGSTYGRLTLEKAVAGRQDVYAAGAAPENKRRRYTLDDTGNAQRLYDLYGKDILYSFVAKRWLYWDGRRYQYDYEGRIKRLADRAVETMPRDAGLYANTDAYLRHCQKARSSGAKNAMIAETQHRVPVLPEQLDTHADLLNTVSGVVNLRDGTLTAHSRDLRMTKICASQYAGGAACPLWREFLSTIFDHDAQMLDYIQRAVGYTLTGSTREQCVFFLYGDGRNGKSTFLDVLSEIMGDYAANIQPESLMVKQGQSGTSDIARLQGARFVTCVEPSDGMRLNEGLLKQFTGGDKITAARKYENEFEFRTEFKLWMAMNHKPIIRGMDEGIWRRIHLIPFTVTIPDAKVDKLLKYKLRAEFPEILKWAVEGCLIWQREGGLRKPERVVEATGEYRASMDVLGAFVAECCERGGQVSARELFAAYAKWAAENNEYEMTATRFGSEMKKRFAKRKTMTAMIYEGVRLKARRAGAQRDS